MFRSATEIVPWLCTLAAAAPLAAQSPRFADFQRNGLPAMAVNAVAMADVDGDGDRDVLFANDSVGPITSLFLNDGHGLFTDATAANLPGAGTDAEAMAVGDVDGDGDPDVVLVADWQSMLLRNDGQGVFTIVSGNVPPPGGEARAVELADVDADGDLDLWVGSGHNFVGIQLFANDGTGFFTDASANLPPVAPQLCNYAIAPGDLDGDGDLDVLLTSQHTVGSVYQFANDGTGRFVDASGRMPMISGYPLDLELKDVDADGDLDVLVADAQLYLYQNDGTGTFTDATAGNVPAMSLAARLAAADFDGDGDVDVWVGTPRQDLLLANDGTGRFTDVTATGLAAGPVPTNGVAAGDLDGDGDPDVLQGNWSASSRVYSNLLRHLARSAVPRIGQSLTMNVWGRAGGGYVLAASLHELASPLPPYGTLQLHPTWLTVTSVGGLDPGGRASVRFPVPYDPQLVSWSLYWQALTVSPPLLGNLELTTFAL